MFYFHILSFGSTNSQKEENIFCKTQYNKIKMQLIEFFLGVFVGLFFKKVCFMNNFRVMFDFHIANTDNEPVREPMPEPVHYESEMPVQQSHPSSDRFDTQSIVPGVSALVVGAMNIEKMQLMKQLVMEYIRKHNPTSLVVVSDRITDETRKFEKIASEKEMKFYHRSPNSDKSKWLDDISEEEKCVMVFFKCYKHDDEENELVNLLNNKHKTSNLLCVVECERIPVPNPTNPFDFLFIKHHSIERTNQMKNFIGNKFGEFARQMELMEFYEWLVVNSNEIKKYVVSFSR
jgi:hypothetical protein